MQLHRALRMEWCALLELYRIDISNLSECYVHTRFNFVFWGLFPLTYISDKR